MSTMKTSLTVSLMVVYFLLCYFSGVIPSRSANAVLKATISTSEGSRIYDNQIAEWIQNIVG